jgi:hypothetical protein
MAKNHFSSRQWLALLYVASVLLLGWPQKADALCAAPVEIGRWRNLGTETDPMFIDLKLTDCGDQVLNGELTETRYSLRVWLRQSSGQMYGRPTVVARYRTWKGQRWLVGRVPTGGYVDNIWARVEDREGQRVLHVLIKHESLDSKPSSTSEHWFKFDKRI